MECGAECGAEMASRFYTALDGSVGSTVRCHELFSVKNGVPFRIKTTIVRNLPGYHLNTLLDITRHPAQSFSSCRRHGPAATDLLSLASTLALQGASNHGGQAEHLLFLESPADQLQAYGRPVVHVGIICHPSLADLSADHPDGQRADRHPGERGREGEAETNNPSTPLRPRCSSARSAHRIHRRPGRTSSSALLWQSSREH